MPSSQIVNLKAADEEGNFPCPTCGNVISPDDETEKVYSVLDTTLDDDGNLEQMVIRCKKCKKTLTLEGFDILFDEESSRVEFIEDASKSKSNFIRYFVLSLDRQPLGHLQIELAQKEDVKAFKRLRKLRAGDAFKCTIAIEHKRKSDIKHNDLQLIAKIAKKKFKGLRFRDIFLVEIVNGRKNLIGRASELDSSPTKS